MAKIFLAFFNGIKGAQDPNAIPLFYEGFIKGLQENGNEVFAIMHNHWSMNFDSIPPALLQDIKEFNPDLIFIFNNSFYDLSKEFDCPIIIYEVDSPLYYRNKEALIKNPDRFKFFVVASSSVDILKDEFKVPSKNILHLPFFTSIQAENIEQTNNICFIGSKFRNSCKNCFNNFMVTNPTDEERKEFMQLMDVLQNDVFITKEDLFKNTTSEKILKTFVPYDITFLLSDYRRIKVLSKIADLGLDIWGTPNWADDTYNEPWLILNFHKEPVYTIQDNQNVYNSSKIGINIGHLQAKTGFPWRVFDIMASNACLVTEYHGDFNKYFPELKLPYFSNDWEAYEQCKKLLTDESYRFDIVQQSQEVVNENYRFINILKIMENYLDISLSSTHNNIIKMDSKPLGGGISLKNLDSWLSMNDFKAPKLKMNFRNKIRYKIWSHYNKILKRKGII